MEKKEKIKELRFIAAFRCNSCDVWLTASHQNPAVLELKKGISHMNESFDIWGVEAISTYSFA